MPWQEDGSSFATNGHIGIMLDGAPDPSIHPADPVMAGRIPKLLAQVAANQQEIAIALPEEPPETCYRCQGTGFAITEQCEECDGDGRFEHGSHNYDCKDCDGNGEHAVPAPQGSPGAEECGRCDGEGKLFSRYVDLHADGTTYKFQEKYLRLIIGLPSPRLFVGADRTEAARFEFEGGRGVLMPCRY
ncbi:Chaperone protein DnaJ [compost metagenome]